MCKFCFVSFCYIKASIVHFKSEFNWFTICHIGVYIINCRGTQLIFNKNVPYFSIYNKLVTFVSYNFCQFLLNMGISVCFKLCVHVPVFKSHQMFSCATTFYTLFTVTLHICVHCFSVTKLDMVMDALILDLKKKLWKRN